MNRNEPWTLHKDAPDIRTQKRWRVTRNEEGDDQLTGKYGVITQYPDGDLDVWVKRPTQHLPLKLEAMGWKAKSHYDDGALFIRPYADLDLAAGILKCHKKRHLSPEARAKKIELLTRLRLAK